MVAPLCVARSSKGTSDQPRLLARGGRLGGSRLDKPKWHKEAELASSPRYTTKNRYFGMTFEPMCVIETSLGELYEIVRITRSSTRSPVFVVQFGWVRKTVLGYLIGPVTDGLYYGNFARVPYDVDIIWDAFRDVDVIIRRRTRRNGRMEGRRSGLTDGRVGVYRPWPLDVLLLACQ